MKALFVRNDSIYKTLIGADNCFDIDRDAVSYRRQEPLICHPPCRAWGQLSHFANPRPGERWLTVWSILMINRNGGVLEHPANSKVWKRYKHLLKKGIVINIEQVWFGHKCRKPTRLYIVGVTELPKFTIQSIEPTHQISGFRFGKNFRTLNSRPACPRPEREKTPEPLAKWLVALCQKCHNAHDAPMRTRNRWQRKHDQIGQLSLFETSLSGL